jgi:UPF0271 protein
MRPLDLNCDLGEGGPHDAQVMPYLTSANVACGAHAGDPHSALAALRQAKRHGVVIGAHPGHADREHFGRRELELPANEVFAECVAQIGWLMGLARIAEVEVAYLKPHGGLYHQAHSDGIYAHAVVCAAEVYGLPIVGTPGSRLQQMCAQRVRFIKEGFADRRYQPNGQLVPRSEPDAIITDLDQALHQVESLWQQGAETICVHGDHPDAVNFVRTLRLALQSAGVPLAPAVWLRA